MENAIDPEADENLVFLRFDVDVGSAHLHRILEHRLQQLDDGCILSSRRQSQFAQINRFAELCPEFERKPADLFRTSINPVDCLQEQRFAHHGELNVSFQNPGDLVITEQVGWIRHTYSIERRRLLKYDCTKTARQSFGKPCRNFRPNIEMLEVDVWNLQLAGKRPADLLFRNISGIDQNTPEFSATAFLQLERGLQFVFRQ